ncbi:hypothetical protein MVEN_01949100 [Mycena venus]|uniref:Rhodopsin domain-containing protein n=1 Tax=Mycena venus TaxID=2733690 RepID=A0A8H7CJY1_9AGAR|nr:hypothetical protein MVEN_01949100 [Mycena venus]
MVATIEQLRILLCILLPFACLVTYFRLYVRYSRGQLWWDDFWAFMATMCAITFVAAAMLHVQDPGTLAQNVKVSVYYMCAQFFYAVVWTARISVMFNVIRLSPSLSFFRRLRQLLYSVVVVFFVAWTVLFAQVWWVCERQPGWKNQAAPQCALGRDVAIAQLITDVLSDTILIAAPISLLWRVKLQRGLKFRTRAVFATTSIGTAVSLYHAYCVFRFGGIPEFLAATLQLSISLLVANLPVLVVVIFQLKSDSETDNVEPISAVIFARSKKHALLSTFGATTTQIQGGTKMDVHIVETSNKWTDDDSGVEGGDEPVGSNKVELKVVSTQEVFDQQQVHFNFYGEQERAGPQSFLVTSSEKVPYRGQKAVISELSPAQCKLKSRKVMPE